MPDRIIREQACQSPTLDQLTDGAERLFWRLTTRADDQGRFDADGRALLASCFPLRIGRVPASKVEVWRDELVKAGLADLYRVGDRLYGVFRTWAKWQRLRQSKPKRPGPDDPAAEPILAHSAQLPLDAASCRELPPDAARARARVESRESLTTESREAGGGASGDAPPRAANGRDPAPAAATKFQIAPSILEALNQAPRLGAVPALRRPPWWQAEIAANCGVDMAHEVRKAEAYLTSHPEKHYRRLDAFLHSWLGRADRPSEDDAHA